MSLDKNLVKSSYSLRSRIINPEPIKEYSEFQKQILLEKDNNKDIHHNDDNDSDIDEYTDISYNKHDEYTTDNEISETASNLVETKSPHRLYPDLSELKQFKESKITSLKYQNEPKEDTFSYLWILVFIIPLLGLFFILSLNKDKNQTNANISPDYFNLLYSKKIDKKYHHVLSKDSSDIIRHAIKKVIVKMHKEPAIVLIIGSETHRNVVKCLLTELSLIISDSFNESKSISLNGETINRQEINEKFHKIFSNQKLHTISIDGIERLTSDTVLSLHQFTDHNNAKFIDAIILLSAYTTSNLTRKDISLRESHQIANSILENSWINEKHLPYDTAYSILTRVTPSVAIVFDDVVKSISCTGS